MAIILPDGKVARNLQEQVCYLSEKVKEILEYIGQDASSALILEYDDEIPAEGTLTEEQLAKAQNDICFLVVKYHEGEANTLFYKTGEDNEDGLIFFESIPSISVDDNEVVIGGIERIEVRPLEGKFYYTYESVNPRVPTTAFLDDYAKLTDLSNYVTLATEQLITASKIMEYGTKLYFYDDNEQSQYRHAISAASSYTLRIGRYSQNGSTLQYGIDLRSGVFCPSVDNNLNLGSSGFQWKDLYLSGAIDFGDNAKINKDSSNRVNILFNNAIKVKVGNTETYFANHVEPDSANSYDLGRSSLRWRNLYLSGYIYTGTGSNQTIYGDAYNRTGINNSMWFSALRMEPMGGDNAQDIGTSTNRIRNAYIAGNISDGTNEKTVKDILTTGFRFALPNSSVAETIDIVASGATSNQLNEGQTTFNNETDRFALKLDNINQWIKRGYVVYKSSTGNPIRIYLTGMSYKNATGSINNMFAEDSFDAAEYAQGSYYLQFGASVNANQQTGAYIRIAVVLSGQGSGNIKVEAFEDQQV